ncbi:MAG: VOC family protein [Burkholderiaceae bacterium]|nr:VOC family protein [Burkholderiaceae bacterium]
MKTHIDHLVVVAKTLEQGVQWCEATLGITPGPGGEHPQFGTHNRLFKIATPASPLAYLEIIAINYEAKKAINTPAKAVNSDANKRWFDMDDAALQAAVAIAPRLVHFVVNTDDIQAARAALKAQGIDRGPAVEASRHLRKGRLEWKITVRDDGQRLFNGALPSLIQWGKTGAAEPLRLHPRNSLPRSGVTLQGLVVTSPTADKLQAAYEAIGLTGITLKEGPANITATLQTPKGLVELHSQGI